MKLIKTHKPIELDKRLGNVRLTSTRYREPEGDKWDRYTVISLWYDRDCENCPMGWDIMSYEGECEDCGCLFDYGFNVPTWKCMLPRWVKRWIKNRMEEQL